MLIADIIPYERNARHNEGSPSGKPMRLSTDERKMVDRVLSDWEKYRQGKS